jgi:hypothetical protein
LFWLWSLIDWNPHSRQNNQIVPQESGNDTEKLLPVSAEHQNGTKNEEFDVENASSVKVGHQRKKNKCNRYTNSYPVLTLPWFLCLPNIINANQYMYIV